MVDYIKLSSANLRLTAFLAMVLVIMLMFVNKCGYDLFVSKFNTWNIQIINTQSGLLGIVILLYKVEDSNMQKSMLEWSVALY